MRMLSMRMRMLSMRICMRSAKATRPKAPSYCLAIDRDLDRELARGRGACIGLAASDRDLEIEKKEMRKRSLYDGANSSEWTNDRSPSAMDDDGRRPSACLCVSVHYSGLVVLFLHSSG